MARKVKDTVGSDCSCAAAIAQLQVQVTALQTEVVLLRQQVAAGLKPVAKTPRRDDEAAVVVLSTRDDVVRQRVALFRSLFAGRDDVYAQRWEKDGKSGWAPQIEREPGQLWQDARKARRYRPLTDAVLHDHLSGKITAGVYPMLADDTCRLLVCDFDGAQWRLDAQAYAQVAAAVGVPVAVEISRSGDGAHAWIFFTEAVPARDARTLGFGLLREAMAIRGELGLDSYDRFFPAQDHLPARGEGLGNLIALPLQRHRRDAGATVFVDPQTFAAFEDQWAYLAGLSRMAPEDLGRLVDELQPVAVGPDVQLLRSRVREEPPPPPIISAEWLGMLPSARLGCHCPCWPR